MGTRHCVSKSVSPADVLLGVEEEGAEAAAEHVGGQGHQEAAVELKVGGELQLELVDAVQELQEDRGALGVLVVAVLVSQAQLELVAEAQPILLDHGLPNAQQGREGTRHSSKRDAGFEEPTAGCAAVGASSVAKQGPWDVQQEAEKMKRAQRRAEEAASDTDDMDKMKKTIDNVPIVGSRVDGMIE